MTRHLQSIIYLTAITECGTEGFWDMNEYDKKKNNKPYLPPVKRTGGRISLVLKNEKSLRFRSNLRAENLGFSNQMAFDRWNMLDKIDQKISQIHHDQLKELMKANNTNTTDLMATLTLTVHELQKTIENDKKKFNWDLDSSEDDGVKEEGAKQKTIENDKKKFHWDSESSEDDGVREEQNDDTHNDIPRIPELHFDKKNYANAIEYVRKEKMKLKTTAHTNLVATNTCKNRCGDYNEMGQCNCDLECFSRGDCCPDINSFCSNSCAGRCGSAKQNALCNCDSECYFLHDCCTDIADHCAEEQLCTEWFEKENVCPEDTIPIEPMWAGCNRVECLISDCCLPVIQTSSTTTIRPPDTFASKRAKKHRKRMVDSQSSSGSEESEGDEKLRSLSVSSGSEESEGEDKMVPLILTEDVTTSVQSIANGESIARQDSTEESDDKKKSNKRRSRRKSRKNNTWFTNWDSSKTEVEDLFTSEGKTDDIEIPIIGDVMNVFSTAKSYMNDILNHKQSIVLGKTCISRKSLFKTLKTKNLQSCFDAVELDPECSSFVICTGPACSSDCECAYSEYYYDGDECRSKEPHNDGVIYDVRAFVPFLQCTQTCNMDSICASHTCDVYCSNVVGAYHKPTQGLIEPIEEACRTFKASLIQEEDCNLQCSFNKR